MSDETTETKPPKLIDDAVRAAALDILSAARELDEWDIVPALVLILNRDGHPTYVPVPIEDRMWMDVHPAAVLTALSVGIGTGAMGLMVGEDQQTSIAATGDLAGVILFTEGHAVLGEDMTDAERATINDFAERHRLEKHPKASELRMANMVDRALTPALAQHVRGKDVDERIFYGITGRMPDAMNRLMTALMSHWMDAAQKTV